MNTNLALLLRIILRLSLPLVNLKAFFTNTADLWNEMCLLISLDRELSNTFMSSKQGSNCGAVVWANKHNSCTAALTKSTSVDSNPKSAYFFVESCVLLFAASNIKSVRACFSVVEISFGGRVVGSMLWNRGGFTFNSLLLRNSSSRRNASPPFWIMTATWFNLL